MKTMKIFEPAMCCPTGLCGVSVDPELLRISTVLNTLKQNGIKVQRFNLTNSPMEFVNNPAVSEFLKKFGPEKLPVVLVDDFIVISGRYPTNAEFVSWLELPPELLCVQDDCCGYAEGENSADCCCEDSTSECCCDQTDESCCCEETDENEPVKGCCCCGNSCC